MNPYAGWYFLGVTLSIWIKLSRYMKKLNPKHRTYWEAFRLWFFEDTATGVTTISVFAFIWSVEVVYVERVAVTGVKWLAEMPLHPAFTILIGSLAEVSSGYFFKRVFNWIFPGD